MARDPEKARERKRRYVAREHAKKFGPGAGDMRGRLLPNAAGALLDGVEHKAFPEASR